MFDYQQILRFFRKEFVKKDWLIVFGLIGMYLATRLINLTLLPIFTDEAIYIHWSKLAWKDASWRFVSLTDGKQPLHTWGMIPLLKLFRDPLFAGRMFSVLSGFFTLLGLVILLRVLWNKKAAYLGAFIYIFTPYYLFFDRLALIDSGVTAFAVWILLFSLLLVKQLRLDFALMFGILAGLGTLAKSTVRLFFLPSLYLPFIYFFNFKTKRINLIKIINFLLLFAVVAGLSLVIYNIQRLSPFLHFVEEKNKTFVLTLPQFLQKPLEVLSHNLKAIPYYLANNTGWLLIFFGLWGLLLLIKQDIHLGLYLVAWFLTLFLPIAMFAKVLSSRYIIFLSLPFVLGFVYLLQRRQRIANILLLAFFLSVAYFNFTILFNPAKIPLPPVDRGQYLEDWPAGHGTRQIVELLKPIAEKHQTYVFTEGTFGLLPYALDIYFSYDPKYNINFMDRWPLKEKDIIEAKKLAKTNPVYFVFHQRENFPSEWGLKLIKKYPRYSNRSFVYLFTVNK